MNNYAFFCLNRGAKAFDVSKVIGVTHTTQFQLSLLLRCILTTRNTEDFTKNTKIVWKYFFRNEKGVN